MKIGIITYHNAINYGAVLQSYALSRYLTELGCQTEIINYRCPAVEIQYKPKSFRKSSSLKNYINHNLTCLLHLGKKRNFIRFNNNLPLSNPISYDELKQGLSYDVIITGSDQVFNPDCNKSDTAFLLDFADKSKRYSYAASMGSVAQFSTYKADTLSLLKQFEGISLREQDAADFLRKKIDRNCITVVDPVWLLSKSDWESMTESSYKVKKPYIFVYNLMDFMFMRDYAISLAKRTGYGLIVANRTFFGDALYFGKAKNASNASPGAFLHLINNSDFFITDSFHGTSLSIILEKKFAIALNPGTLTTNSRFASIVDELGLSKQIINGSVDPFSQQIDFYKAKERMSIRIEESKDYLNMIVKGEYI